MNATDTPVAMEKTAARWWVGPLWRTLAAIYPPQLLPLLGIGPLTECGHCVRAYLKLFAVAPGAVAAHWLGVRTPLRALTGAEATIAVSGLIVAVFLIFPIVVIAGKLKGRWRWAFLAAVAILSAINALGISFALRM